MMTIPYDQIAEFCQRHHLRRMWLFGSILRDDFSPESDVDVLVEFDSNHIPGWEFFGEWREELEAIFKRPVDLGTPNSLRPRIQQAVMQTARMIYERN